MIFSLQFLYLYSYHGLGGRGGLGGPGGPGSHGPGGCQGNPGCQGPGLGGRGGGKSHQNQNGGFVWPPIKGSLSTKNSFSNRSIITPLFTISYANKKYSSRLLKPK